MSFSSSGRPTSRLRRRWSLLTGRPRLRWSIRISAPADSTGDVWGDLFFAEDLAESLRRLGQSVTIDRLGAPKRAIADDVVLHLVGLHRPVPVPGAVNILWVISHPELVTDEEFGLDWDERYAASASWGDRRSTAEWTIRPLLQATNPSRFTPTPTGDELPTEVLFVGKTRNVFRPIVRDAVAAGVDLAVYGDGWEEYIDPSYVRADFLPNDRVPAMYRGARVVLNDHWQDMAETGFASNRLFDAVAAGARVITDAVDGLPEEFGDSVRVYHSVDELAELARADAPGWPDAEERARNAAAVAEHHSFDARAQQFLADAVRARRRHRKR
jgi:hypothetical protein